jgi:peptide/nickel transport system substrate-binding protein
MKCHWKSLLIITALFSVLAAGTALAANMETFTLGLPADATNLDPHFAVDSMSFAVARHINEPLVTVDGKTKELVPVLAERWEIIDPQTYKFYLRKDVKFHNGEPFTAEDVVFSFTRAATESSHAGSRGRFIDVNGFEIIDDHTLIVKTVGPVGGWLDGMKHPYASILNKKAVEEAGDEYFRNPIGTGPFKFKRWVKGERIELEAFGDYYGKAPSFKNFSILVLPDDSSRVIALETGKADLIYAVPPSDMERLNAPDSKVKAIKGQGLNIIYLGMNTQKKPLDDPRVRQAIDYAINKEAYDTVVYQGNSSLPDGPLPPASTFSPANAKAFPYDLEKAKKLLADADYEKGFNVKLWISNYQDRVNGATVLQNMLAQVGIKVDIEVFESGVFDERVKTKEQDMIISTWGMQTNRDAGQFWLPLFHSKNVGTTNWTIYDSKETDDLIDRANTTVDATERNALLQQIWDHLIADHPMIGLSVPNELYGARKDLVGVEDLYDGRLNYLGSLTLAD